MSDSENKMPQNEIVGIDCIQQRDGGVVEYDNIHIMLLLSKYETIVCNLYLVYLNYKHEGIMKVSEYNTIIEELENIIDKIKNINHLILIASDENNDIIGLLQEINDKLSTIMKLHGAHNVEDILFITC